ncbi:Transcription initiation factor IIA subunit 2 [Rhodotorula kratochvilovae]
MSASAAPAEAATQTPFYQIYRRSALGTALVEALDELINSGHINPQLALMTLNQARPPRCSLVLITPADFPRPAQFDKSASQALQKDVKAKATIKAQMRTYNHVWTFILQNPTFKLENNNEVLNVQGKCRIVACKSGDAPAK